MLGQSSCNRTVDAVFDPTPALASPGVDFVTPAAINYWENDTIRWAGPATLSFSADTVNGPVRGSFTTVLDPVDPNPGSSLTIDATFCAEPIPVP